MDLILDELQKNNVKIGMKTRSHHINCMIERYKWEYEHMLAYVNHDNISRVFTEINFFNFGRAMAYLSIVYLQKEREAARLVATPLEDIDSVQDPREFFP